MYNNEICNLGVTVSENKIYAAVLAPGCDWCQILVHESNEASDRWIQHKLQKSSLFPSVFTGSFSLKNDGETEYLFENENGYFLDPYARLLKVSDGFCVLKTVETKTADERKRISDTLGYTCIARKSDFDWKNDKKPCISYSDMILYKLHVRGFTSSALSGVKHPGTFKGISEKIKYLKNLGVNAILLQPCYDFNEFMDYNVNIGSEADGKVVRTRYYGGVSEKKSEMSSRVNFWGYGTQALYYAPKASYASDRANADIEFKTLIRQCHLAGIEVLMEIDYGNSVSDSFILENLRFWAGEYHIDGFRFDGGRIPLKLITGDAYLSNMKMIVTGADDEILSSKWCEGKLAIANDSFQDTMRRFLKGDEGQLGSAAGLFKENGGKAAKINYIADHNGFTLNDCFCYDERHNEANGEKNYDGREANFSWNCGAEGITKKRKVLDLRNKMIRNALALTILSQGTPMLFAGDEFGNTHFGNNNPYCQDNEQGWVNWERSKRSNELLKFVRMLISLKKNHRALANSVRLLESDFAFTGCPDISFHGTRAWYPDFSYYSRAMGVLLNGEYAVGKDGKKDISFYILMNMHWEEHGFDLPMLKDKGWKTVLCTDPSFESVLAEDTEKRSVVVQPRSIVVLCETEEVKKTRYDSGKKVKKDKKNE